MADDFFTDDESNDPFNEIINNFFGRRVVRQGRSQQRSADYSDEEDLSKGELIESKDKIHLIFDIPGFSEKDISISSKGDLMEIKAQKKSTEKIQDYLSSKLQAGLAIKRNIPEEASKKFTHTYKNGILEVIFEK